MEEMQGSQIGADKQIRPGAPETHFDILSACINDQATNTNNKDRIQTELISPEIHMVMKKDDMDIKKTIIPINETSKVGLKKCEIGDGQSGNNKIEGSIQPQQSNQPPRVKRFTCQFCNRCFGYKHVLQNHERIHTGEMPHFCKICDKRFSRCHHLKVHMRLHTGEKPYDCSYCGRQFVQVANLRRHLRVHTGELPYSCGLCSSQFADSSRLKFHMRIHEDIDISSPTSIKRERKSRKTRRIVRVCGFPVSIVTYVLDSLISGVPEQTHPEDLSLGTVNGLNPHFSGSHSSVNASSSPTSEGSHG